MRCSRVQFLYEDYVSGQLPEGTAERVDEHLTECAECREYFETNDDLAQLLHRGNDVAHPGDPYIGELSGRVLGSIFNKKNPPDEALLPHPNHQSPWRRPVWFAGGFAALALLVFGFHGEHRSPAPDSEFAEIPGPMQANLQAMSQDAANQETMTVMSQVRPVPSMGQRVPVSVFSPKEDFNGGQATGSPFVKSAKVNDGEDPRTAALSNLSRSVGPAQGRSSPTPTRRAPNLKSAVAPGILEQMILSDVKGTTDGRDRLLSMFRDLERAGEEAFSQDLDPADTTLLKQWFIYRQASLALSERRMEDALNGYAMVLKINPQSVALNPSIPSP